MIDEVIQSDLYLRNGSRTPPIGVSTTTVSSEQLVHFFTVISYVFFCEIIQNTPIKRIFLGCMFITGAIEFVIDCKWIVMFPSIVTGFERIVFKKQMIAVIFLTIMSLSTKSQMDQQTMLI